MNLAEIVRTIYERLVPYVPVFRGIWAGTVFVGLAMLVIGLMMQKNAVGKKSPWILSGIGLVLMVSAGVQLIVSFVSGGKA